MKKKILSKEDLEEILTLQALVYNRLEDKKILETLSREEYEYILDGKGLIVGIHLKGELIAFRALLEPEITADHLGLYVGLSKDELSDVIYQEISIVHPEHRGKGLQKELGIEAMQHILEGTVNYKYICSTVSPYNIASLKDKFSQQMRVKALACVYADKLRYVFIKSLYSNSKDKSVHSELIPLDNISKQQEMINKDGWIGTDLIESAGNFYIKLIK